MSVRDTIEQARAEGRAALIGYLPVGFPDVETSVAAMRAMVAAGVDIVEVGIPYSDPLMDGPVIQRATEIALAGGTRTADALTAVRGVVDEGAPALVMTYWNLIDRYGVDRFAADLAAAGGSGLITPDLIPDEGAQWRAASDAHELDRVYLVAPSSTPERIAMTVAESRGFVYAASLMGVTGERGAVGSGARDLVSRVRAAGDLPVCVGLGVSNGAQAAQVAAFADGVIVGSAFVRAMLDAPDRRAAVEAVAAVAADLAAGVRSAQPAVA
ncbi:tryptophan synthase subunit alpha [Micromonospora echinofusca]|uniref:Tryptophan synthase alpha chain n=1 Tax=Micromonospora echinofusca TaxID=47858 RepID=A0ABS3VW63_MICEH|nr:tryptophan synthase subunit alpha [Micromonospora echinofusca]MBO4208786.1 tryptophan synthase subunit alpha [Micromonospora echinofusca]